MKISGFKNHDWFMTLAIFMMLLIGLVVIYSATFTAETLVEGAGTINRQLVFVILGIFIYFIVSNIDPAYYRYFPVQVIMFVIILGLLLYVWLFGDPIRYTNRWIEWGFIRIQPSEYAKVVLILLNSSILANVMRGKYQEDIDWGGVRKIKGMKRKIKNLYRNISTLYPVIFIYALAIIISASCIVLVLVEPALGNASIIALICIALFLIAYPNQKTLLCIVSVIILSANVAGGFIKLTAIYDLIGLSLVFENLDIGIGVISALVIIIMAYVLKAKIFPILLSIIIGVVSVVSVSYIWNDVLKDYQRKRIEVFMNPEEDPQGAGWQLKQAKIAIGSGRIFGKGFLQGSQSKLRYLPEAYSDFIFAAFCEEFGLVGAAFLMSLYIFLVLRIIRSANKASSVYESIICFGVAVMILIHVFINTAMNMGIMPITGIPLPLISYGGSSIMVTMIALGLVQAVNMHKDMIDNHENLMPSLSS